MAAFFFYGTLLDPDVLRTVLGRRVAPESLFPARLAGYRISRAFGKTYPILAAKPGAEAKGLVAAGLDDRDAARLFHYEDDGYSTVEVDLAGAHGPLRAWVFMPGSRMRALPSDWSYDTWQRGVKARVMPGIEAWMARYPGPDALPLYRRWRLRRKA